DVCSSDLGPYWAAPAATRISGSRRRPVRRFFCPSTRKSQGAAPARLRTKASRLGSRRCSRRVASTSASRSGRWQRVSLPPSRSRRKAQAQTSSRVHRPSWRAAARRSEEHTSELQSRFDLVCRLLLEKKKNDVNISLLDFTSCVRLLALSLHCTAVVYVR